MNIFILDTHPECAARDQCNKHVVKMIVESAQMLCGALSLQGTQRESLPYKPTHLHHPCTVWVAESSHNAAWLLAHSHELCREYTRRYGKRHKTQDVLERLDTMFPHGDWNAHSPFAQAMPEVYRDSDAVKAYRAFYIAEKSRFARWEPRTRVPAWWPTGLIHESS